MRHRGRLLLVTTMAALFVLGTAGQALATICINPNKKLGAGNIGTVVVIADTAGNELDVSIPANRGGQVARGGFIDLEVWVDPDGDLGTTEGRFLAFTAQDLFLLNAGSFKLDHPLGFPPELPHGAHNAGPGDDLCDGVGVDDVEACPAP